ncbi:MAG: Ig-like domain-containing protein [Porticoccaceae bacterium]|nr:Ig-like domain-containing protein [Porticoccaceae bacterium]
MLAACGGSGSSTGSDTANNTDTISSIEPMDSDSEGDAVPVDDENAEDGGPNDADGMANGTLADLGGIAIKYIGVPSANSRIVLDESTPVANCTDTTTITVWAYDEQQLPLTNMLVTATTDIQYVTVSRFVDQGDGSYIATMTAGTYSGIGQVQVEIDNGDIAVALLPERLALTAVQKVRTSGGSGGCTVATGRSTDSSLILILVALLLFRFRRRGALNVIG